MKILTLLTALLLLFSCKKHRVLDNTIDIGNALEDNNIIQDHAYDVQLIPLNYDGPESIVINMVDLLVIDGYYYVIDVDKAASESIKVFSSSGEFIKSIKDLSYNYSQYPISFVTNYGNDKLIALDKANGYYLLDKDLNIISKRALPFKAEMVKESDGMLFFYANKRAINQQADSLLYNFIVTDTALNVLNKFDPFTIELFSTNVSITNSGSFSKTDELLWTNVTNDTIYTIGEKGKEPGYIVDFEIPRFDPKEHKEVQEASLLPILQSDFSWGISNIIQYDGYLFFNFYETSKFLCALYDKKTNNTYILNPFNIVSFPDALPWPRVMINNELYGWYSEGNITWFTNWEGRNENSVLAQVKEHIESNVNPVLIKYKLRL